MPDSPTGTSLDQIHWSGSTDALDEKRHEVQLEPEDDPQRLSLLRRWLAVALISSSAHFVAFASSVVRLCYSGSFSHLTLMLSPPGSVHLAWHFGQVSCWTRSCHLEHKLVCNGAGHRPSFCWSNIRALWAQYRLSHFICFFFCLQLSCRLCS